MNDYKAHTEYVVRKPLFPYTTLFKENETLDLNHLCLELLQNDAFVTSIYWSSPDVYALIVKYKAGKLDESKEIRLFKTLKKYAIRICTRAIPYGTMAGIGIVSTAKVNDSLRIIRKARVDMTLLTKLKDHIEGNQELRRFLGYKANNTTVLLADQYRYLDNTLHDKNRFQFSSIERTIAIDKVAAIKTITSLTKIEEMFSSDFTSDEISGFIDELIEMKFLISELQFSATSDNFQNIKCVIERIIGDGFHAASMYKSILEKIESSICIIENTPVEYLPILEINELESMLRSIGINEKHFFHIDLNYGNQNSSYVQNNLFQNILKAVSILESFSPRIISQELSNFKTAFEAKYEQQEISLTTLLDPEYGLGFPIVSGIGNNKLNSLIEDVQLQNTPQSNRVKELSLILDIIENNKSEVIDLDKHNFEQVDNVIQTESFYAVGASSEDGFFLQNVSVTNIVSILGRFASFDNDIKSLCEHFNEEKNLQNPEVIYAEIIFLPEQRIANVIRHPQFSMYEIPIVGNASRNAHEISLSDILVTVQNNRIILKSRKLNRRIIPQLSNAHNFNTSTNPFYRFLCEIALQDQNKIGLNIDYNYLRKRHYPRIVFKNIILFRKRWVLFENDLKIIKNAISPRCKLKSFLKKWCVDKYVVLIQGDNELFLDIENETYQDLLLDEIKNNSEIHLTEWVSPPKDQIYNEQIILPIKTTKDCSLVSDSFTTPYRPVQRQFIPGSEWLYFKIYCNSHFSDEIVRFVIKPFLENIYTSDLINLAFFVHYVDPDYHIRFRIKLINPNFNFEIIQRINSSLNSFLIDKKIWKIQLDTYCREIERYGATYIENTEASFFHDSLLITRLLHSGNEIEDHTRLFLAVKNIEYWFALFNYSLKEKIDFCNHMEDVFLKEFSIELKNHIKLQYRELKEQLNSFLNFDDSNRHFELRQKQLKKLKLDRDKLASYIHMSINRWFPSDHRALELMTYSFAKKRYNNLLYTSKHDIRN